MEMIEERIEISVEYDSAFNATKHDLKAGTPPEGMEGITCLDLQC